MQPEFSGPRCRDPVDDLKDGNPQIERIANYLRIMIKRLADISACLFSKFPFIDSGIWRNDRVRWPINVRFENHVELPWGLWRVVMVEGFRLIGWVHFLGQRGPVG